MAKNNDKPMGFFGRISRFFKRESAPEPAKSEPLEPKQPQASEPVAPVAAPVAPAPEPVAQASAPAAESSRPVAEAPKPIVPPAQPEPEPAVVQTPSDEAAESHSPQLADQPSVKAPTAPSLNAATAPSAESPANPVPKTMPGVSMPGMADDAKHPFGTLVWDDAFELPLFDRPFEETYFSEKKRLHVTEMSKEELAKVVSSYVFSHISSESLSVEVMAQQLRVSRTGLYHMVYDTFGVTPANYILYCRLNYAASLLHKGHKVRDVSSRCGFSDPKYFSKVFRKYMGVLPSNFSAPAEASANPVQ